MFLPLRCLSSTSLSQLWCLINNSVDLQDAGDKIKDAAGSAKDAVKDAAGSVKDAAGSAAEKVFRLTFCSSGVDNVQPF